MVDRIVAPGKIFPTEQAYLAHIHCAFLDIARDAFIFFQEFCLNAHYDMLSVVANRARRVQFLNDNAVYDCDMAVIEYLVFLFPIRYKNNVFVF